ncbi:SDR family oxidoreductase [Sphingorhabdus sp.]|jgi:NAD(P)-dependent dehydrogenase (short-subunit alcohol dehydrogenase family)|uniref:SDR family oxidoreductase n=1 Tax=Sphingorhabdus sp. TaxID=1902408 RepID=UPI003BB0EDA8|nr:SDR family oxidoreductase [Sphingomonadales bacterium]MBK9432700.1 SDR family oxidoreductase [Sphingomonadales bacterium]MBL0022512.1 SDR family oxidoreductase [Sphingomonadales bacterium]
MDINSLFNLKGRTALVTGGSRGIGAMIVEGYLAAGAERIYISARKVDQIEAAVEQFGDKVVGIPLDLSTVEGCRSLAAEIAAREDKLDILVNNAGAAWGADFESFPEAGWDRVMDLNVKSLFFLTQALHPQLKAAASFERPAKVINIASIDGMKINPWQTYSYQASKAAVIHLTRRMAAELAPQNILVSGIAPGAFQSEMNKAARDFGDQVGKNIPFPRIGTPEDMAGLAIYLASRAGDYIVGETIACDGGIVNASLPQNGIAP